MKFLAGGLVWSAMAVVLVAQTPASIRTGPGVGEPIPAFSAPDQNGVERTSASILGPKGALLVFFRSADW